jgi:bacterioferritin-associated ferredoxin
MGPIENGAEQGKGNDLICRCHGVRAAEIAAFVRAGKSLGQIIDGTLASTNCGSCGNDLVREFYRESERLEEMKTGQLNLWAHLDLNQGPRDYESPALTN